MGGNSLIFFKKCSNCCTIKVSKLHSILDKQGIMLLLYLVLKIVETILIILFLLSKTQKLRVPVVTLPAKYNKKLSKFVGKEFERSVYSNDCKALKVKLKMQQMNLDIFSNQTL